MIRSLLYIAVFIAISAGSLLHADQPIFGEMPRWDNGWGIQLENEYRTESDLLLGTDRLGPGFSEEVNLLHVSGVYTWDKSIRLTFKLPYVLDARRELLGKGGAKIVQYDRGIGDLTLALPLKRYFNLDGRSGSWTIAPQFRVPLAKDDEYSVYDHVWGQGLSLGYETETYKFIFKVSAEAWVYYHEEPFESQFSIDIGYNLRAFKSSGHVKWETDLYYEGDNSVTLSAGPALYWRFTDTIHGRVEWKYDFYDRQGVVDHGNGNAIRAGLAVVF